MSQEAVSFSLIEEDIWAQGRKTPFRKAVMQKDTADCDSALFSLLRILLL